MYPALYRLTSSEYRAVMLARLKNRGLILKPPASHRLNPNALSAPSILYDSDSTVCPSYCQSRISTLELGEPLNEIKILSIGLLDESWYTFGLINVSVFDGTSKTCCSCGSKRTTTLTSAREKIGITHPYSRSLGQRGLSRSELKTNLPSVFNSARK